MNIALSDNDARRRNALHRAMFLKSENRFVDALFFYIVVLYYDMHYHVTNEEEYQLLDLKFADEEDKKIRNFEVYPSILSNLLELKEYYSEEMVARCYDHLLYPYARIPQEDFAGFISDIFKGNVEIDLKKYITTKVGC